MDCMDMLVKLYDLDDSQAFLSEQKKKGIFIRKPLGGEKQLVKHWVSQKFSKQWASEAFSAMSNTPGTCFLAVTNQELIGFCCYDASALGFCGPIGVDHKFRGNSTGTALLFASLSDMKAKGYGYAIIGWVNRNTASFYQKAVNAVEIPDSFPGIFKNYLPDLRR